MKSMFCGMIRNKDGAWFAGYLGIITNMHAKLMALKMGLELEWALGIRSIMCEFDSMAIIELINRLMNVHHSYAGLS